MDKNLLQESNKEANKIVVSDAIRIDNKLWFMSDTYNGLFCMDIESEEIEIMETFPGEAYTQRFLYSQMQQVGDKIYFSPYFAKEIAVYDIKSHTFEKIDVDIKFLQRKPGEELFIGIQQYDNFLFFIPAYSRAIIRMNLLNHELIYITEWLEEIEKKYDNILAFVWGQWVLRGNKLFLPFLNMNAIMEFDCDSLKYKIRSLDIDDVGFSGVCDDGKKIWLYTRRAGNLIGWNSDKNKIESIDIFNEGIKTSWDSYARMISFDNRIMYFGVFESQRKLNESEKFVIVNKAGYMFARDEEDYIIFCERGTSLLTIIDKNSRDVQKMVIETKDRIIDIQKILEEKGSVTEMKEFCLDDFLNELKTDKILKKL